MSTSGGKEPSLTGKQRAFVLHYLETMNATEATRRAGYRGNDTTLRVTATHNLAKPNIRAEIDRHLAKTVISAGETLSRVTAQATGTMEDFVTVDEDGVVRLDLAKAKAAGKLGLVKKFQEVTVTKGGETTRRVTVELYGADAALDKLMRYHSLYNDRATVQGDEARPIVIQHDLSRLPADVLAALADYDAPGDEDDASTPPA
jgi:phage terminase small subunit